MQKDLNKVWGVALVLIGIFVVIGLMYFYGTGLMHSIVPPGTSAPASGAAINEIPLAERNIFKTTLQNEVKNKIGMPIEGYEPMMFLQAFPGLTETDFDGVKASIGSYAVENGRLVHKMDDTKLIHSAAKAITDRGMDTLLVNVSARLGIDLSGEGTITQVMEALMRTDAPPFSPQAPKGDSDTAPLVSQEEPVACTMEAKICPDGSAVGRQGPFCEFAPCP